MKDLSSYGRDALLLETLSMVAKCQDEKTFWADAMALRNPDNKTYNLQTLFELRPDEPLASRTGIPLGKGIVGKMMRSGESCHCFSPQTRPFADECIIDESLEWGSLSSILSVSLQANRNVLGILSFGGIQEHAY